MELKPRDISVAGFFHDIGKFLERAKVTLPGSWTSEEAKSLYQPYNKNGNYFTHAHSRFSAYFFECYRDFIPSRYHFTDSDSCIPKLSARHHIPSTALEWIVAEADRISSGYDREEFEVYNHTQERDDYRSTRLISLFESAGKIQDKAYQSIQGYRYRYPLRELDVDSCYPIVHDGKQNPEDYETLFEAFDKAIRSLNPDILKQEHLWLDAMEALLLQFTSFIPSATVGSTIPDVSLFDHLKSTSAIAGALFAYHKAEESLDNIESVRDRSVPKFLLVQGKFFGIQSFIFQEGGSTNKKAAKILRARSAMVNLILEAISSKILSELELSHLSRLLYGAGKFTLLLPNTEQTKSLLVQVREETNRNLYKDYYGKVSIGLESIPVSAGDLLPDSLEDSLRKLHELAEEGKFKRWLPGRDLGVFEGYLNGFHNTDSESGGLCSYCGERPEDPSIHLEEGHSCAVCADQIDLGTRLFTKEVLLLLRSDSGDLRSPFVPGLQYKSISRNELKSMDPSKILRQFDLQHLGVRALGHGLVPSPVVGYVPYLRDIRSELTPDFFTKRGLTDEDLGGNDFSPISFWGIGALSTLDGRDGSLEGVSGIAGIKADVDRLGELFRTSFRKPNLSRMATFSRFLDYFFTDVLRHTISSHTEFKGIYTVFSGGDDLFLIAPYRHAYAFLTELREKFSRWTCNNEKMSFSAGISFHKPGHSIRTIGENSEMELENAKTIRNAYSLFREKCSWQESEELWKTFDYWNDWRDKEYISTGFAYRIHSFIQSRHWEKLILDKKVSTQSRGSGNPSKSTDSKSSKHLNHLLWRSHFKYSLVRTFATGMKREEREQALEEALQIPGWIEKYGNLLKHTLWYYIYNHRKKEKNE